MPAESILFIIYKIYWNESLILIYVSTYILKYVYVIDYTRLIKIVVQPKYVSRNAAIPSPKITRTAHKTTKMVRVSSHNHDIIFAVIITIMVLMAIDSSSCQKQLVKREVMTFTKFLKQMMKGTTATPDEASLIKIPCRKNFVRLGNSCRKRFNS